LNNPCTDLGSQNVNISEGIVFDGEPYIAVNLKDPDHMVIV